MMSWFIVCVMILGLTWALGCFDGVLNAVMARNAIDKEV